MTVLALAWAVPAGAQDAPFRESTERAGDESYVADPNESFIVEHSGQIAEAAPRRAPAPSSRCREYTLDENDGYGRGGYGRGLACPQPDGSWRIVSGHDEAIRPRARDQIARNRAPYPEYPDYTDDARDYEPETRPTRRFRLDWGAWSFGRRAPRTFRDRYND